MSITIKLPPGRGKPKIDRPWAKTVTAVAKNATSGHAYEGEWLTYGSEIEAEAGDIIAIQDKDGDGACLWVLRALLSIRGPRWLSRHSPGLVGGHVCIGQKMGWRMRG